MPNLRRLVDAIRGRIQIDHSIIKSDSPLLLHISDTPSQFYPELNRIIRLINPEYIIHTGDLADNIKIGLSDSLLAKYQYEVKKLLDILNSSKGSNIHITLGNHDKYEIIKKDKGSIEVYDDIGEVEINGGKFVFSHYSDYLDKKEADVYMFGHNIKDKTLVTDSGIYLNGILSINIVNLNTMEVECIRYPVGTDSFRLNGRRIKI